MIVLEPGCPIVELYAGRLADMSRDKSYQAVGFIGLCPTADQPQELKEFVQRHRLPFPVLVDPSHNLISQLRATHVPEVFVLDDRRVVRYRGRIDDQYAVGAKRAEAARQDLAMALDALLAGRPVAVPRTEPSGCMLQPLAKPEPTVAVTFSRDISPILQSHCVSCHQPGEIGPFSLTSYADAKRRAKTMLREVDAGRMPPWSADPAYGHFKNDQRLTDNEKAVVRAWVAADCPEGDAAEMPTALPLTNGWRLGQPDCVLEMQEPFTVPERGVIKYQYFMLDPKFTENRWVRAVEIRPGNRSVVHHALIQMVPKGKESPMSIGTLESQILATMTPGSPPWTMPDGMAKAIPAGCRLRLVVHYSPTGIEQTDRTSVGLYFAQPDNVRKEVATRLIDAEDLVIPAHDSNFRVERSMRMTQDVLLLSMFPHMHLRGKSFRYEAVFADGTSEVLLNVPNYDFNWQHRYDLATPKRLKAGTEIRCIAHYDNSAGNPANPNPEVEVHYGEQSWDEMFNGYVDLAPADQNLVRSRWRFPILCRTSALPAITILLVLVLVLCLAFRSHR